ncbi:cytochrome d ubiquinol oxidase subunit II [Caldalkalibacillus uzonensis]|uniref:Cytochrome d ubiquinol oxidase subunit II n=1 Tax=Caldalkalibacillus uzonensis TaxID=353224 RepID=A0ABU0CNT6_9BACI|nr:cytochrome d ubiquinol oxidase subunit II [Caldalkalibacillus uzonensis]MDQ0338064.1 cytochrome d ubiquinol oxidase subunit II [Caldalkalibacillus uzonensis]
MTDALLAITMLWIFVMIYAVAAAIDFGAGFWAMFYMKRKRNRATTMVNRFLSPSWEVTNVFVVLIVVALFSFFPGATFTLGTVLLIPGSLVLLLLLVRSAFLVFAHSVQKYKALLTVTSGVTGLLIPAILVLVLPIAQGGLIEVVEGLERLDFRALLTSTRTYAFSFLAVVSSLYLSALFLSDYANEAGEKEAYRIFRRNALFLGPVLVLAALSIVGAVRREAEWFYANLEANGILLILSLLFFVIGYGALFLPHTKESSLLGRPRLAVISTAVQFLLASATYGMAHLPYLVYPVVTLESGFTHPNTFRALFLSFIIGFLILTPGFVYFWKMFLKDTGYLKQE